MTETLKKLTGYFSKAEIALWCTSCTLIIASFCIFDRAEYMTLAASLIGVTSLLLNAKGNPLGQLLTIIFSVFYGIISFSFAYYGEMITYLGMTAPMAVFAIVMWLRHPYNGKRSEVAVNRISGKEAILMLFLATAVTAVFYFILDAFDTANIVPSTISVTTSFLAVYLTARRSEYFPLAYAANDIVLIVLWTLAAMSDISYISVVICFAMFLANDIYGFINWSRMKRRQNA